MGFTKWIAGYLGWVTFGPIGGILGFFFGAAVEGYISASRQLPGNDGKNGRGAASGRTGSGSNSYGGGPYRRSYTPEEQRNSFLVSLLVLSAAVIKADGKTLQSELDYVKDFVRKSFGAAAVPEAAKMLEQFTRQEINIYEVGRQIAVNMNYSQRLQLFHYLVQVALADGDFHKNEKSVLEAIGSTIGLNGSDISSVISMFYKEVNSAYSVLGVSPSASDDEVKAAYRRMAMKNHPDKVATLGPDIQKAAAEKFRQVQEAYESIKKERGM